MRLTLTLTLGLGLALGLALVLGAYALPVSRVPVLIWQAVSGQLPDTTEATVLFRIRLPRILAALLIGAGLSAAGAAYQSSFRNPLVSPDLLGVSAGAGFGAILGIFLGLPVAEIQLLGFVSGLLTVALVITVTRAIGLADDPLALVLTGVAVGALAGAGIALLKTLADPEKQLPAMTFWLLGSLAGTRSEDLGLAAPFLASGLALLGLYRWRIAALALGEDEARALGLSARRLRWLVIGAATLMTSAAVSMAGMIGWIGLMAPHMARLLVGPRFDRLLPVASALGGGLLVLIDTAARTIAPTEVPLGVLTAVIGAPLFLALLALRPPAWT